MTELTPIKCPNCGADIEVNKELEKAICQYCGETVLIKNVIQNAQFSHKAKVDGIDTNDERIERAQKHIKLKEYNDAIRILQQITYNDKFNCEAYAYLLIAKIGALKNVNFNVKTSRESLPGCWKVVDEIIEINERLKKIDEKNETTKILDDYTNQINDLYKALEQSKIDEKELEDYTRRLNAYCESYMFRHRDKAKKVLEECFERTFGNYANNVVSRLYSDNKFVSKSLYKLSSIDKVCRDGTFIVSYTKSYSDDVPSNPYNLKLYVKSENVASNPIDVEDVKKYCEDIIQIIDKADFRFKKLFKNIFGK